MHYFPYTVIQWIFFFYIYCFCGWIFESCYVSIRQHKWVNRGFMSAPFLPLYGTGAIMMLIVSAPFRNDIVLTYLSGCVGATALEYITGVAMEALFKVRYWDYSDQRFQYKGYICLSSTLAWGGLTILMTRLIHTPIEQLVLSFPKEPLTVVTMLLTVWLVSDFNASFRAAMDLRDILIRMERAKDELERLQRRLDVVIAVARDEGQNIREDVSQAVTMLKENADIVKKKYNLEELYASVNEKMELLQAHVDAGKRLVDFELLRKDKWELYQRYLAYKQRRECVEHKIKKIFMNNPRITSVRFKEFMEEMKQGTISSYKAKKDVANKDTINNEDKE